MSPPPKRTGLAGFWANFGYAWRGLCLQITTEANTRIHLAATVILMAVGFWCGLTRLEWCAVVAAIGLVWVAEGLNTAIERLTDLVSPDYHKLAEQTKDMAAGAVLSASIAAGVIGVIIFGPHLLKLLGW